MPPYSRKAYFICQKYELQEILQKLETRLNDTFANDPDNREHISEIVEAMEQAGRDLERVERMITREEELEALRENDTTSTNDTTTTADDRSTDDEPSSAEGLPPLVQLNPLNLFLQGGGVTGHSNSSDPLISALNNVLGGQTASAAEEPEISDEEQARRRRLAILRQRMIQNFMQTMLTGIPISLEPDDMDEYESLVELENVAIPIKEECLAKIPTETYSEVNPTYKGDKNIQCSVCLLDFEPDDQCRHLPCDHLFHQDCIEQWFKEKARCPVCNIDVNEVILKNQIADQMSSRKEDQSSDKLPLLEDEQLDK